MATKTTEGVKKTDGMKGLRLDLPSEVMTKLTQVANKNDRSRKKHCEKILKDHANSSEL